jgi:hypothetical protein
MVPCPPEGTLIAWRECICLPAPEPRRQVAVAFILPTTQRPRMRARRAALGRNRESVRVRNRPE